jgi:tRNA threonylcarbamoyladenosine modification (KEOPS) complex  Pcc1 subunit
MEDKIIYDKKIETKKYSAVIKIPKDIDYQKIMGKIHKYKRSNIELYNDENSIIFNIYSTDLTALRASLNMLFRDLHVIQSIENF